MQNLDRDEEDSDSGDDEDSASMEEGEAGESEAGDADQMEGMEMSEAGDEMEGANRDSKTALQEWAHSNTFQTPVYKVADRKGPDHAPTFVVQVVIEGTEGATGKGRPWCC